MKLDILSLILSSGMCLINIYQHELSTALPWGLLAIHDLSDVIKRLIK